MTKQCPVCRQALPHGLDDEEVHQRLEKLNAGALEKETKRLEREYRARAEKDRAEARERALKEGRAASKTQIAALTRKLQEADGKAARLAEASAKRAASEVAKQNQAEMRALKEREQRQLAQHQAETARYKAIVDSLQQKLEKQTSEQLGGQAEVNVFALLKAEFPGDDISRIGTGVRGADIVHRVLENGRELGRIVYECKNTSDWAKEWVTKAKKYRSEYQTPWVVIATRTFPRKEQWFAVEGGVPVIDLRLVARLAEIIRASVVEAGQLRLSTAGQEAKAHQLFDYVLSDHFTERFRGVADAVAGLREQQRQEQQWHANAWAKQAKLHDEVDARRREIGARIKSITDGADAGLRVVAAAR